MRELMSFLFSQRLRPDACLRVICLYVPAVSLHFSLPACICTTHCSDQCKGGDTQCTAFPRSCLKKMCCSVSLAVDAGPTCCSCGLCKHSSLITIRKLSLNSLALWLVWRAKICIQNKALEIYSDIVIHSAAKRIMAECNIDCCGFKSVVVIRWM